LAEVNAVSRIYNIGRQGCQMVYFQTKNTNLGKFWKALKSKMSEYFMAIWNILWPFGTFYGHFGNLVVMWYIFFSVLVYCIKKNQSGSPVGRSQAKRKKNSF
jgi:hypothetical protein